MTEASDPREDRSAFIGMLRLLLATHSEKFPNVSTPQHRGLVTFLAAEDGKPCARTALAERINALRDGILLAAEQLASDAATHPTGDNAVSALELALRAYEVVGVAK